jgi:hypothetical protein
MNYDIGDLVRLMVTFQNLSGTYVDPSTLILLIQLPDGTKLQRDYPGQVTKTATGQFQYDYLAAASGVHYFRWEGTGTGQGAAESEFEVNESVFRP